MAKSSIKVTRSRVTTKTTTTTTKRGKKKRGNKNKCPICGKFM